MKKNESCENRETAQNCFSPFFFFSNGCCLAALITIASADWSNEKEGGLWLVGWGSRGDVLRAPATDCEWSRVPIWCPISRRACVCTVCTVCVHHEAPMSESGIYPPALFNRPLLWTLLSHHPLLPMASYKQPYPIAHYRPLTLLDHPVLWRRLL